MDKFKPYIPLAIGIAVLMTILIFVFNECLNVTNGKFIYILDDAYIHLAYAKNIVVNNVSGITRYENSSSSSSPLWTLILVSIFYLTGVNEFIPLIINIVLSLVLITMLFFLFKRYRLCDLFITISLLTVIIVTPLAINIFSGMEHLLQAILAMLFIFVSVKDLVNDKTSNHKDNSYDAYIYTLSAVLILLRYEDIILIGVISVLFIFKKNYIKAFLILLCGIIPVIIYGLVSVNNGGYFIPNSVLVKLTLPESIGIFTGGNVSASLFNYININKKIIFLFIFSAVMFILQLKLKKKILSEMPVLLLIIISTICLQKVILPSSFFRYDTYLIVTGIAINVIAINDYLSVKYGIKLDFNFFKSSKFAFGLLILFSVYLIYKCSDSGKTITASKNIYEQQYQMSQFINKYYSGKEVALNDIGTVNFFADIRCTDLIGIGSNEVVRDKLKGNFNTNRMKEIAEKNSVKIAVLYEKWFDGIGGIPASWSKAGEWKIRDNFICGDDAVTFYAVSPDEIEILKANLKSFSRELPEQVIRSGVYLNND
ncbi:MAG: hypothetical protein IPL53_09780 [Ignavibacteria bacterium]|nr:hypothetical protein [Ignavibacteria bacterium]